MDPRRSATAAGILQAKGEKLAKLALAAAERCAYLQLHPSQSMEAAYWCAEEFNYWLFQQLLEFPASLPSREALFDALVDGPY